MDQLIFRKKISNFNSFILLTGLKCEKMIKNIIIFKKINNYSTGMVDEWMDPTDGWINGQF